jgi:hypothetical protein
MEGYATKVAPTQAGFDLAADLKVSATAMSAREADVWRANNPDIVKMIEEQSAAVQESATMTAIDKIVQDVTGQLVGAGYSPGAATQLATVMRGIGVLAERMSMDPMKLYDRIFGGVRRVSPQQQMAQDSVDLMLDPYINRIREKKWPSQREMFGPSLMDLINEAGGINPDDPELQAMDFELGAQDMGVSKAKLGRWKKEGKTLADIAEVAAEQGYLPERSENQLIEAIRRELSGELVYGSQEAGSEGMRDISAKLDELAAMIDQAGLDLDNLTNEEVRAALEKRDRFLQVDTKELRELTEVALAKVRVLEDVSTVDTPAGTVNVDRSLAETALLLPEVDDRQDFGDITFTDTVRLEETGKRANRKVLAQRQFDRAVKRRNLMKRLLDCVSG